MDIAEFIAARLNEAEARATALQQIAREAVEHLKEPRLLGREIPGWHSWPDVDAMCTRTLADIAADRAILAMRDALPAPIPDRCNCGAMFADNATRAAVGQVIRIRAERFSDHPEYREEWTP